MKKILATLVLAGLASSASAVSIVNGDFSAGLTDWNAAGNVGASAGTASVTAWGELSQAETWSAGDTISFNWFFQATDYLPYDDWSVFQVKDDTNTLISNVTLASVSTVGDNGNSGWQSYTYTFASSGTGSILFGSYNAYDNALSPSLYVNSVKGTSNAPEPSSLLMLGLGLAGLGFARKRAAK